MQSFLFCSSCLVSLNKTLLWLLSFYFPPSVDQTNGFHFVPFLSHMLYPLDSAAAAQLHHSTVLMFCYHLISLSQFLIGQLLTLVTIFLLGDSVCPYITWSVHCPYIVYKPLSPVSCFLASSMQFSLVSSFQGLPWDPSCLNLPLHEMVLLGCCNSSWNPP